MKSTKKQDLQDYFLQHQLDVDIVRMYEENEVLIHKIIDGGSWKDRYAFLMIKSSRYANALIQIGQRQKALVLIKEVQKQMKPLAVREHIYPSMEENTWFLEAVCLGRLKRYKESSALFKRLLKRKPDNDIYQEWYKGNQKAIVQRVAMWVLMPAIFLFVLMVVAELMFGIKVKPFFQLLASLVGFGGFFIGEVIKWRVGRRKLNF